MFHELTELFFSQVLTERDALKYGNYNSGLDFNPGLMLNQLRATGRRTFSILVLKHYNT